MFILIDNSIDSKISFFYCLNTKWIQRDFVVDKTGDLLVCLDHLLKELGKDNKDIKGLAVRVGKGRFTATRVAVTVANTLAYSLAIPVLGITDPDFALLTAQIQDRPLGQYVSAKYSGTVHIGGKK